MFAVTVPVTATEPVMVVEVRETGTVLLGLMATTRALSVATAAVLAALTVAMLVPSVSFVCCVPPVRVASRARVPAVPMFAVIVPETATGVPEAIP
jgi:hypothetical protein